MAGVWLACAVRVFIVDCESGSGAFWTRGTTRRVLPGRASVWAELARVVRDGLAWVSDLGAGVARAALAPKADFAEAEVSAGVTAFKAFFECVLSEGFAVAWDCLLRLRWMVPVHGGAWVERAPFGCAWV